MIWGSISCSKQPHPVKKAVFLCSFKTSQRNSVFPICTAKPAMEGQMFWLLS